MEQNQPPHPVPSPGTDHPPQPEPKPGPNRPPQPEPPEPKPEPPDHPPQPEPKPPLPLRFKVPDQIGDKDLATQLAVRLMGTTANGAPTLAGAAAAPPNKVIWVDHGNEVLVHLDSIAVRILDRTVLVSVDLETDQTGRSPLVCSFAIGGANELGGLVATTDELPRGLGMLASCWGRQLQSAVWSSLMGLVNDHAGERNLAPRAFSATAGVLSFNAGSAFTKPVFTKAPGGAA